MTKTYWEYKRAKYINIWYYFVKTSKFVLVYILNKDNITDFLTKLLLRDIIRKFAINFKLYIYREVKKLNIANE